MSHSVCLQVRARIQEAAKGLLQPGRDSVKSMLTPAEALWVRARQSDWDHVPITVTKVTSTFRQGNPVQQA